VAASPTNRALNVDRLVWNPDSSRRGPTVLGLHRARDSTKVITVAMLPTITGNNPIGNLGNLFASRSSRIAFNGSVEGVSRSVSP